MLRNLRKRFFIVSITLALAIGTIAAWNVLTTKGATYTWDDGGTTSNWSDCDNWTSDTCPGASDIAQFDGTVSDTASTIDGAFGGSVAGVDILANYTATITQSAALSIGTSDWSQAGGTFTGGASSLTMTGAFTLSGGTFTAPSGTWEFDPPSSDIFTMTGGTLNHNSGSLLFSNAMQLDIDTVTVTLNNFEIDLDSSSDTVSPNSSDTHTFNVTGTLTLTNGNIVDNSGGGIVVLNATGPISVASSFDGADGRLNISGGAGTITVPGGADMPITNLSTARLIDVTGSADWDGGITISDGGSFDGGSGTINIRGAVDVSGASTFTASSGTMNIGRTSGGQSPADDFDFSDPLATFDANGGTIELGKSGDVALDVNSSITFNNLTLDSTNGTRDLQIASGDTVIVAGTLLLDEGAINGPGDMEAQSTVTHLATFGNGTDCGSAIVDVTGASSITPAYSGDVACFPGLTLTNAGSSLTGPSGDEVLTFSGDVTIAGGTLNAGSGTTELRTGIDLNKSSGTFNDNSGTVRFAGGTQEISGAFTLNNLTVNSSTFTFPSGSTTTVDGDFFSYGNGNGNQKTIQSSSGGSQATVEFDGTFATLGALDLKDIAWSAGSDAQCHFSCLDSGNNTGITFNKKIIAEEIDNFTTEAGGTATFDVVLSHRPNNSTTVAIGVSSSDTGEGTPGAATLTFNTTNWDTPQTVTVTGQDDVTDDGDQDYSITLAAATSGDDEYSGFDATDIAVVNKDDDITAGNVQYDFPSNYAEQSAANTEIDDSFGRLERNDFVATTEALSQDEYDADIFYDSVNDSLWFSGDSTDIVEYDIATSTEMSHGTGGSSNGSFVAYDSESTRNRFWMSIPDDDEVVAFNDDGTVFGTFSVNSETGGSESPNRIIFSDSDDATASNDAIWIGNENPSTGIPAVTKLSAVDGSPYDTNLATSTYDLLSEDDSSSNQIYGLAYDSGNEAIWVFLEDQDDRYVLVELNESDGSPFNGSLADSSYIMPDEGAVWPDMVYDETNDYIWIMYDYYVIAVDTGEVSIVAELEPDVTRDNDENMTGMEIDSTNDTLYLTTANGTLFRYDIGDELYLESYATQDGPIDLTFDSEGDIWALSRDYSGETMNVGVDELDEVRYGVDENDYYTVVTTSSAAVDGSAATVLGDVTVTETLNSQQAYYSLGFGAANTYKVWGSWREIASDRNSVTGLGDGTWGYRDNASTWTAASSNNAQTAISQAVAAGSNNQMSGTTLDGLSQSDLESAGGWSAGDDIYVGITLFSDDSTENPSVDTVNFDFTASSGNGGTASGGDGAPTNLSITAESCSAERDATVLLSGTGIDEYLISENADFAGAAWQAFIPNVETNLGVGIAGMSVKLSLSENDGLKTIYIRFRSNSGEQSGTFSLAMNLDQENSCESAPTIEAPIEPEPESEPGTEETVIGCEGLPVPALTESEMQQFRNGVSPKGGQYFASGQVHAGDYIRGETFTTVYCITRDLERRPYIDETSYFTQTRTFNPVKWLRDESLADFPLGPPMLPEEGVTLIKFETDENVYYFKRDAEDPTRGILRWITTEELAAYIAGDNWADYVIDLNPTLTTRFQFAAPYITVEDLRADQIDVKNFRKRELLNENSSNEADEGVMSRLLEEVDRVVESIGEFIDDGLGSAGFLLKWLF